MKMETKKHSFTKDEHIRTAGEFQNVFNRGLRVSSPGVKLFYRKNKLNYNRIGLTLPRGYGNAIERNRTKRCCREAYRVLKPDLSSGYDLVFILYSSKNKILDKQGRNNSKEDKRVKDTFKRRLTQFKALFSKMGILNE